MNQRFLDQSYYEILEIRPDAPENEIHRAYLKAKETYSPDSPALYTMFSPEEADELSRLIEEAYSILSNHAARREYDNRLLGRNINSEPVLPEHHKENNNMNNVMSLNSKTKESESIPKGFAKSKFSIYEMKPEFEKEVNQADDFTGEFLAKIRAYKKVSLENLSDETRVSRSYLRAIESDDYKSLPADVFVRGFVVQYAKALGLNADKAANSYMKILRNARNK